MSWRLTHPEFVIGHWLLRNNAFDISGKENHGVWVAEDYEEGPFGGHSVGKFNGSTTKIDTEKNMVGTGDLTVSGIVRADTFGENNNGRFCTNGGLYIYVNSTITGLRFTSDAGSTNLEYTSWTLKKVYHIICTRLSSGVGEIYLNGKIVANGNTGTPIAGTTNFIIGNQNDGARTWDGIIGSLALRNIRLTGDEAMDLYRMDLTR